MKKILFFILLLIFIVSCQKVVRLERQEIPTDEEINKIPDQYEWSSYSVKGFLNNKETLKNALHDMVIEGYVTSKYTCPPCPKGALCKPCVPDYITLSDFNLNLNNLDYGKNNENYHKINEFINKDTAGIFGFDKQSFNSLKIGDKISILVDVTSEGRLEFISFAIPDKSPDELMPCDISNNYQCPEGYSCNIFKDFENKPVCWLGFNPCDRCQLKRCDIAESFPPQITCR